MKEFFEKAFGQLAELVVLFPSGGILLVSFAGLWVNANSANDQRLGYFTD